MRSTPSRSPYRSSYSSLTSSSLARSRTLAAASPAPAEPEPAADADCAADGALETIAPSPAVAPPAAVLVSNLPAANCNGLYVLVEDPASESPRFQNGEGQHLYRVKEFERRALSSKWVISSTYSPGGSSLGRRAVLAWEDGETPPMGERKWLIIADSTVLRSSADESTLLAPVTLTAIPESSVAALTSMEGAAQRARSQQREVEAELEAVKRELKAKVTDASKSDAEGARLDEKAQRAQGDLERNNARFEGLLQDKVSNNTHDTP